MLVSFTGLGQEPLAEIFISVVDQTGAPVPNFKVNTIIAKNGIRRILESDAKGEIHILVDDRDAKGKIYLRPILTPDFTGVDVPIVEINLPAKAWEKPYWARFNLQRVVPPKPKEEPKKEESKETPAGGETSYSWLFWVAGLAVAGAGGWWAYRRYRLAKMDEEEELPAPIPQQAAYFSR